MRLELAEVVALVGELPAEARATLALGPTELPADCRVCRVLGAPPVHAAVTAAERLSAWHAMVGEVDDADKWASEIGQSLMAARCMVIYLASQLPEGA